jgi:hypothetical protein
MKKGLRFSEAWFQRGLWLIAIIFANFLIGLGSLVVSDLPHVDESPRLEQFVDQTTAQPLRQRIGSADTALKQIGDETARAQLILDAARNDTRQARAAFQTWIASRTATSESAQNPEIARRTQELDALVARERTAERTVEGLRQRALAIRTEQGQVRDQLSTLEDAGRKELERAQRASELRVFALRLAVTLPLLAIAGWLFVKQRKSRYWPFVWGFIFFAGFAFFVELVPYLPSYGGYVRYLVGILLTGVIGHYAIRALQRYLERQREVERQPDSARRQMLDYDVAQSRLAKKICPGCERPVSTDDPQRNFCMHCGICLFNKCAKCDSRKNAFAHYCHACGSASVETSETPATGTA